MQGDRVVPSQLALDLQLMGFDLITWSFERADLRKGAGGDFYYAFDPTGAAVKKDSDMSKSAGCAGEGSAGHRCVLRLAGNGQLLPRAALGLK